MYPCASDFSRRIKSGDCRPARQVRMDPAHCVVRRRMDRYRSQGNVDSVEQTGLVDARKALRNLFRVEVRQVEVGRPGPRAAQLSDDGSGDDVAGSQVAAIIVTVHERFPGGV